MARTASKPTKPTSPTPHTRARARDDAASPPYLLTLGEAAARMRYSRAHIYRLIASGELRAVGSGRARRLSVTEIERWISSKESSDDAIDAAGC